jgi:hypothetical protein
MLTMPSCISFPFGARGSLPSIASTDAMAYPWSTGEWSTGEWAGDDSCDCGRNGYARLASSRAHDQSCHHGETSTWQGASWSDANPTAAWTTRGSVAAGPSSSSGQPFPAATWTYEPSGWWYRASAPPPPASEPAAPARTTQCTPKRVTFRLEDEDVDCRQPLPPVSDDHLTQVGPVATATDVLLTPPAQLSDFWAVLRRPGGFDAMIEANHSPFDMWRTLPDSLQPPPPRSPPPPLEPPPPLMPPPPETSYKPPEPTEPPPPLTPPPQVVPARRSTGHAWQWHDNKWHYQRTW